MRSHPLFSEQKQRKIRYERNLVRASYPWPCTEAEPEQGVSESSAKKLVKFVFSRKMKHFSSNIGIFTVSGDNFKFYFHSEGYTIRDFSFPKSNPNELTFFHT